MTLLKYLIAFMLGFIGIIFVAYIVQTHPDITTRYQVITLTGSTFDMDVTVLITDDTAFAARYVKGHLDTTATAQDFDARAVTFTILNGRSPIIWIPNNTPIEIVNHELLHATISIMNWAGVPLNNSTEEVYAYELQHLSNEFYNQIKPIK